MIRRTESQEERKEVVVSFSPRRDPRRCLFLLMAFLTILQGSGIFFVFSYTGRWEPVHRLLVLVALLLAGSVGVFLVFRIRSWGTVLLKKKGITLMGLVRSIQADWRQVESVAMVRCREESRDPCDVAVVLSTTGGRKIRLDPMLCRLQPALVEFLGGLEQGGADEAFSGRLEELLKSRGRLRPPAGPLSVPVLGLLYFIAGFAPLGYLVVRDADEQIHKRLLLMGEDALNRGQHRVALKRLEPVSRTGTKSQRIESRLIMAEAYMHLQECHKAYLLLKSADGLLHGASRRRVRAILVRAGCAAARKDTEDLEQAIKDLEVKAKRETCETLYYRGVLASMRGQPSQAESFYRGCIEASCFYRSSFKIRCKDSLSSLSP